MEEIIIINPEINYKMKEMNLSLEKEEKLLIELNMFIKKIHKLKILRWKWINKIIIWDKITLQLLKAHPEKKEIKNKLLIFNMCKMILLKDFAFVEVIAK